MHSTTHLAAFVKKHVVLLISQKDYVPFYKLPRWIIGLCGNMMKICTGCVEVSQTGIWLDRQEGKCFGSEMCISTMCLVVELTGSSLDVGFLCGHLKQIVGA